MEMKSAPATSSWKPTAPSSMDQMTEASKAPKMGMTADGTPGMYVPEMPGDLPKLPGAALPGLPLAAAHNHGKAAMHFGSPADKMKVKSDLMSNYGCSDSDCPSY